MRRILVEAARRKKAAKHGGGRHRHDVNDLPIAAPPVDDDLIALDEALTRFAQVEPQKAELVKLRYFVGLTIEETAAAPGIVFGGKILAIAPSGTYLQPLAS